MTTDPFSPLPPRNCDPALRSLLARWQPCGEPDPEFEHRVWKRVERAGATDAARRWPTPTDALLRALRDTLWDAVRAAGLPQWAMAALCLGAGVSIGAWQARQDAPRLYAASLGATLHAGGGSTGIPAAWLSHPLGEIPDPAETLPLNR
jgi:hypothetical protein